MYDVISYIVFLLFLGLVVRGYRDPNEYDFSKALEADIVHNHFQYVSFSFVHLSYDLYIQSFIPSFLHSFIHSFILELHHATLALATFPFLSCDSLLLRSEILALREE